MKLRWIGTTGLLILLSVGLVRGVGSHAISSRSSQVRTKAQAPSASGGSAVLPRFAIPNENLRARIEKAQKDLASAIVEERVDPKLLRQFYQNAMNPTEAHRLLKEFPQKTAKGFARLRGLLAQATQQAMAADRRGNGFFQAPASMPMPRAMVEHALYLERLPVSEDVANFVQKTSQAPGITDDDIKEVAQLCGGNWPCIEKSAYTWIKSHQSLTPEQHALIQTFNPGA